MNERPKILVVDDEPEIQNYMKDELGSQGYRVLSASDGASAVQLAQSEVPHLILLDLKIPILDGYQVLKRLKSDVRSRHIPVLVITGRVEMEWVMLAVECGADGCMVKPVHRNTLLEQVQSHLAGGPRREGDAPSPSS